MNKGIPKFLVQGSTTATGLPGWPFSNSLARTDAKPQEMMMIPGIPGIPGSPQFVEKLLGLGVDSFVVFVQYFAFEKLDLQTDSGQFIMILVFQICMVLWNLVALRTLGFRQNDKKSEILLGSNVPRGDRGSPQQSVRTRVTKNLL